MASLFGTLIKPPQYRTDIIDEGGYVPPRQAPGLSQPLGGIADLPPAFPDSGWPPKGGWQLGDFPNALGNLANWVLANQAGLVPQQMDIFRQILQGQIPAIAQQAQQNSSDMAQQLSNQFNTQMTDYLNTQLLQPMINQTVGQIQTQLPHTLRQIDDSMSGGMAAQAKAQAIEGQAKTIADAMTGLQTQLGAPLGMNALQTTQGLYRDAYNNSIAGLYNPLVLGTYQSALGQNPIQQVANLLAIGGQERVGAEQAKAMKKSGGGGMFK